jgi:predicted nucleic acid-binding protein
LQVVIADTGPINYLLLVGHIEVLQTLFQRVILPAAVCGELQHPKAPKIVREWITAPPSWADLRSTGPAYDPAMGTLDAGEAAAIALAIELHADLILMDDREGATSARNRGFRVAGTLGILAMAADHGLIDLADAFARLRQTNFHYQQEIMNRLLADRADPK